MSAQYSLAYSRFGLGARPGDLSHHSDLKAALAEEISDPSTLLLDLAGLTDGPTAFGEVHQFLAAAAKARAKAAMDARMQATSVAGNTMGQAADGSRSAGSMAAATPPPTGGSAAPPPASGIPSPGELMLAEITARVERVQNADIGFGERLVAFWANHFAVQTGVGPLVQGLAGAFEREAIRPFVTGRFADMLLAATRHPAMLISLNNYISIGPDSLLGRTSAKGLNENHARELMELHSVGVDAGYSQTDVTDFARVLTGWTINQNPTRPDKYGRFFFNGPAHEPGRETVMGKVYRQSGVGQGVAVIEDLAANPATAVHIATKLVRHFVSDDPDPKLVAQLATTFQKTHGDLKAVTLALIEAPAAWSAPATKLKTPQQFLWSSVRALGLQLKPRFVISALTELGQPLWNPPTPKGFEDDTATWLAPGAMTIRVEVAELMAAQANAVGDPRQVAVDVIGSRLSPETAGAIARAESRVQGLALLLMSPEFQRS